MNQKKKKPLYKKWWFIIISIVVASFLMGTIGLIFESDEAKEKRETEQAASEQKRVDEKEDKAKQKAEKKAEEKEVENREKEQQEAEAKQKKQDALEKKEVAEKKKEKRTKKEKPAKKGKPKKEPLTIDKKIVDEDSHIEDASLSDDGELLLTFDSSSSFTVNTVAGTYVYWSFESVNKGFKDDSVKEISVAIKAPLQDNKGNESENDVITYTYTKESFSELNFDNFLKMASSQEWRILNEADSYFMHPAIYDKIKDQYKQNLSHGKSKVRKYE